MSTQDRFFSVRELLRMLLRKEIQLPGMQRLYVWQKKQVCNFLDSLYRGYPTGTILVWEADAHTSNDERVPTRNLAVSPDRHDPRPLRYYLLDGQQRLTSLLAVVTGKPARLKKGETKIDILFNMDHPPLRGEGGKLLSEGHEADPARLLFALSSKKLASKKNWISVTRAFNEANCNTLLKEKGVQQGGDFYNRCHDNLLVLQGLQDFEFPMEFVPSDASYEIASEIFTRVNTGGSKLRRSDLALAQIDAKWRGADKKVSTFENECAQEYKIRFESDLHVRNLISFATDAHKCGFAHARNLSEEKLHASWGPSTKGMVFALKFLANRVEREFPALLSSPFPLITIANYANQKGDALSEEECALLRFWCLVADMKGRYGASSETALDSDLDAVRKGEGAKSLVDLLERRFGSLEVRPDELITTRRGAHFRSMFLAFRKDGAEDWKKSIAIALNEKKRVYAFEVHHIFPQAVLKERQFKFKGAQINTICNLAFVSAETNKVILDRRPEDYLPECIENKGSNDFLKKQCVPTESRLWKVENYEEFLEARRKLVTDRLNKFLADPRKKPGES